LLAAFGALHSIVVLANIDDDDDDDDCLDKLSCELMMVFMGC